MVEVALVLAVSGILLIGIISTTNNTIARQRYNDSVQNVAEQIRVYYSQANNPQGPADNGGRGNEAFYGKLIIFSSEKDSDGASVARSYTIIGNAEVGFNSGAARNSSATAAGLQSQGANLHLLKTGGEYAVESHTAPWGTTIEKTGTSTDPFTGALLILYAANGGVVHTYFADGYSSPSDFNNIIQNASIQDVNLCINSPDLDAAGGIRRNIRISADGRNSSAVTLVDVNDLDKAHGGNQCQ